ncbi:MAG: hypothetical protein EPN39_12075 [Chitinophagaceae bacterium]|nr:MAG: hypothetical protein EPN39_12075 [Chitinophagaceae bacterium]
MNEQNVKFLEETLFYLGFGEKLPDQLEAAMKEGKPEFKLQYNMEHPVPGKGQGDSVLKDSIQYELNFKKGKDSDMYFFNSYKAELNSHQNGNREQLFYVNKNKGVTTKEAYNLLSGRAVHKNLVNKEGERYNAWLQLDFSNKDDKGNYLTSVYHENYGFKLEEALSHLPLKGQKDGLSEQLVKSLNKGNLTSVTFSEDGKDVKRYLTANPKYKSIDVFDENGKPVIYKKNEQQEVKVENVMNTSDKKENGKEKTSSENNQSQAIKGAKDGKKNSTKRFKVPRTRMAVGEAGKSMRK